MYLLRGKQGPVPGLPCCLLATPPLSLHSLPSPISSCLDLPFGTQGRSWKLESVPNNLEMGDTDKFPCPGTPQVWLSFNVKLEKDKQDYFKIFLEQISG